MNSETDPIRIRESNVPTVAPWRSRLDTKPSACRCVTPFVTGHEPDCFLAPAWVRIRHALITDPVKTFGDLWAVLWVMVIALLVGEAGRWLAGSVGFFSGWVGTLLAFQIGTDERMRRRWQDWRRGYTLADVESMQAKYQASIECRGAIITLTQGEWRAFLEMIKEKEISVYRALVAP